MEIKFIDSHIHFDILIEEVDGCIDTYKDLRCGGISWCFVETISSYKEYKSVWDNLKKICEKASKQVPMYYLVGIHPRSIPEDLKSKDSLPSDIDLWLKEHLSNPRCLGLGELGIDSEEELEAEIKVFKLQLDWCVENLPKNKRIGIHTPRANKEKMTEKILRILEDYASLKEKILIDHTTPNTWSWVHKEGYMCGLTLQSGKCTIDDLKKVVEENTDATQNTILNSDSAHEISDYFVDFLKNSPFDQETTRKLALLNSKRFFGI